MKLRAFDVAFRAAQRGYTADEIRPCLTTHLGGGVFEVDVDHPSYPRVGKEGYKPQGSLRDAANKMLVELGHTGVLEAPVLCGTELKALFKDWLGIESTPTCSCNAMAAKMDSLGPEWCKSDEGMSEILGVMQTEHAKRWADGSTILPWSDIAARQLLLLACRRAAG
jgi:hypothetical protein